MQEILLADKESRQLRGEQRVNRGYRLLTGRISGGKLHRFEGRVNIKELISRTRCRSCREQGCQDKGTQVPREMEKKHKQHSLSSLKEITARHVTLEGGHDLPFR